MNATGPVIVSYGLRIWDPAGPAAPGDVRPDNRTVLQQIAGERIDTIGRANNHQ